jgi:RND family efflux transporter MFP subunit
MSTRWMLLVLMAGSLAACGPGAARSGPSGAGAIPPLDVRTVEIEPKPIPDTSDFIATVRSLRSSTVQPQAEGIVRRIYVRAGDRVRVGEPLLQIDPDKQEAQVSSLESARAAREADVALARQQLDRVTMLFEAGAVSRQELEQAEAAEKTTAAQLREVESQIRESRVELQYYRLTAPASGTLGDISVRPGDRVTRTTVVTTIDGIEGLEAYISVPLEQAPRLRPGLPVELLDSAGGVAARNAVTFIAPRADDATQTVLVKSLLRDVPEGIRVLQYLRARIVWSSDPGIAVPVVAVTRVSGQYFVFTAEPQEGGYVARQRPVQLGAIVGEEYVVRNGLEPGQRIIVSNLQKVGDGMPVRPGS